MHMSVRVPPETGACLEAISKKTGKTKSALIIEAINEKYRLQKDRSELIRNLAGWMKREESRTLRRALECCDTVDDVDWP